MFNEEGNVEPFVAAVEAVMREHRLSYELVLVDDGSRDATWQRICEASRQRPEVRGLCLSRNFGHQNALFAGLHHTRGQAIVSMDGDLQHPPSLIPELVDAWRSGYQVVTTVRQDSADAGWFKRLSSRWFYRVFSRLTNVKLGPGASDFRLLDAKAQAALLEMRDVDLFLRGLVSWLGFRTLSIPFQADQRNAGVSKYSLRKMVRFSTGAMLSFSMLPLKAGIWLGFLTSILSFIGIILVVIDYFQGNTVRGWASVMVLMSMMFGVSFVLLGTIGLYLGKIYEVVKGRPLFIVGQTAGFDEAAVVRARSA
jgi:glycosyltransferase involved in cell wall biosynthesis